MNENPTTVQAAVAVLAHLMRDNVRANLILRHRLKQALREFLAVNEFVEFDTPVLGGRIDEYPAGHIKAELSDGRQLWLAQSPQLHKQMLIASGYERYMQFAHCFREEHASDRRDCLREFIQVDFEMVTERAEDVRLVVERMFAAVCARFGVPVITPFPVIDADECIRRYGTDRPDLRHTPDELAFLWVVDFPLATREDGEIRLVRHPMARPMRTPTDLEDALTIRTHSYDLVLNGYEVASGDLRIHRAQEQEAVLRAMGLEVGRFGDLLDTLAAGCPPHGGFGLGLDRLAMRLAGEDDVAEVTAFPVWSGR